MFKQWGGDIIGMTVYPEVVLAAEKEMCYATIAMVTDLDVWAGNCPNCGTTVNNIDNNFCEWLKMKKILRNC